MKKILIGISFFMASSAAFAQWSNPVNGILSTTNNVGIGTATPETPLHVNNQILSTGPDAGLKIRDINGSSSNNDYHVFVRNGFLMFAQGNAAASTGFAHPGFMMAIGGQYKTLQLVAGLQTQGSYYGQGTVNLYPEEGEKVSGIAHVGGASYMAGKTVDLQLNTWVNNQRKNVMRLTTEGNVGIGTTNPGSYRLAVEGKIGAREIEVKTGSWADFVFKPSYNLRTLTQVERFIRKKGHLPDMPSEAEVNQKGVALGEMNVRLLQKIEELTLYMIDQQKHRVRQQQQLTRLQKEVANLRSVNSSKRN